MSSSKGNLLFIKLYVYKYPLIDTSLPFLDRLSDVMSQYRIIGVFVTALEQLSQPDALFSDWFNEFKEMIRANSVDKQLIG